MNLQLSNTRLNHLKKIKQTVSSSDVTGKIIIASFGEDPNTGKNIRPKVSHFKIDDISGMQSLIKNLSSDVHRNIYIPYALMRPDLESNKKGSIEDVVAVFGLCADFDDERASEYLDRLPLKPNFVLETSQGRFQAVYLFNGPVEKAEAITIATMLQQYSECDHGTKDISHVWRVEGTLNCPNRKKYKSGRSTEPQLVQCVYEKGGGLTDFNDLKEALNLSSNQIDQIESKEEIVMPTASVQKKWDVNIEELLVKQKTKELISIGRPRGERSEALMSVINSLISNGFEDNAIVNIILSNRIGEKANEKRKPEDWLRKQIKKAHEWLSNNSDQIQGQNNPKMNFRVLEDALIECIEKPEAVFKKDVIIALSDLKKNDLSKFEQYRGKFKNMKGVTISRLDKAVMGMDASEKSSSPAKLIAFIKQNIEIFRDQKDIPYLQFSKRGHKEIYPIGSQESDVQISYMAHKKLGVIVNAKTLKTVNTLMEGISMNEGSPRDVFLRHGYLGDSYYIDLCNEDWEQLEINKTGVNIIQNSPVAFRRTRSMQSLPRPVEEGDISLLWHYVNVNDDDQLLIIAFILESYRPNTQYPILEIIGPSGSGKSTTSEFLRFLIDPNRNNLISAPKNYEDIFVSATNNALINYNNLSGLTKKAQDALCAVSTGGSFSTRKYYSNFDEIAAEVLRPVIINGLSKLATNNDLAQRSVRIVLPEIKTKTPESSLKEAFLRDRSKIFHGLLELFSDSLEILPDVGNVPSARMGDFVKFGEAVSQAIGNVEDQFISIYKSNKKSSQTFMLERSPVGNAILSYFKENNTGIKKELCKDVHKLLWDYTSLPEKWPEKIRGFTTELRKVEFALSQFGIAIKFHKRIGDGIPVSIEKTGANYTASVASKQSTDGPSPGNGNELDAQQSLFCNVDKAEKVA